jgi:acetoin utilization protein AcuB
MLARLAGALASQGGNIVTLGTFGGQDPSSRAITFKVQGIDQSVVESIVGDLGAELLDLRQT